MSRLPDTDRSAVSPGTRVTVAEAIFHCHKMGKRYVFGIC